MVHDPCVLRHEPEVYRAVRHLVDHLGMTRATTAGQALHTRCCGEGASVGSVRPDLAGSWADFRVQTAGPHVILTYCAGCAQQLAGPGRKVLFFPDLLAAFLSPQKPNAKDRAAVFFKPVRPPFTYTNRLMLKARLLKKRDGF